MAKKHIHTPEGFKDLLFKETKKKREIESKIRSLFITNNFNEVDTTTIEYLDTFRTKTNKVPEEKMFKFFDSKGKTLVLRPDITTSIARMSATTLKDIEKLKFSYIGNVFRAEGLGGGKLAEFTQCGVEYIGDNSVKADVDVIILAIKTIQTVGIKNFSLDIGFADKTKIGDQRLKKIFNSIKKTKYAKYVSIDNTLSRDFDYDTGIIFRGFASGIGFPILSGARYDRLISDFGMSKTAVGFSLDLSLSLESLTGKNIVADDFLKIALAKGRLSWKSLELFKKIGCDFSGYDESSRDLIYTDKKNKIKFFFVKPADVPTYVYYGSADIGIVGRDTVLEEGKDVIELLDLKFAKCKIVLAAPKNLKKSHKMKRVATKYPNIAKHFFETEKEETIEIIKLNGSIELAPICKISEVIIDLVETGTTLKENGLEILEKISDCSATLIGNRVSVKMKKEKVDSLVEQLKRKI